MPELVEAPPAASDTPPPPVPATDQAVMDGDQAAFKVARAAERGGKPLPPPEATTDESTDTGDATATPAISGTETRPVSKRQQDINDRIRAAVENATKDASERIRALEAQLAPPRRESTTKTEDAAPAPFTFPTFEQYVAEHEGTSYETYLDARHDAKTAHADTVQQAERDRATRATQDARDADQVRQTAAQFVARRDAAKTRYPDFEEVALKQVLPAALKPDTPIGAFILTSKYGAEVLYALQKHPAELTRVSALTGPDLFEELVLLGHRLTTPASPKSVSDAPPPPPTLGSRSTDVTDPIEAAVVSGDQAAFKAAKLAKLTAQRR